jgi:hypothetical protein
VVRFGAGETRERGDRLTQDTIARIRPTARALPVAPGGGAAGHRISVIAWLTDEAEADKAAAAMIDAWHRVRRVS